MIRPTITSVEGYRLNDTEGEIVFHGAGLGDEGKVILITLSGPGSGSAVIKSWTDTKVVVEAAARQIYKSYNVVPVGAGGVNDVKLQSPISTHDLATPPAEPVISAVDFPAANQLRLVGTDLDAVTAFRPLPFGGIFYNPAGLYGDSNSPSVTIVSWTATEVVVESTDPLSAANVSNVAAYDDAFNVVNEFVFIPAFTSVSSPACGTLEIVGENLDEVGCVLLKRPGNLLYSDIANDPKWTVTPTLLTLVDNGNLGGQTVTEIIGCTEIGCDCIDFATNPGNVFDEIVSIAVAACP